MWTSKRVMELNAFQGSNMPICCPDNAKTEHKPDPRRGIVGVLIATRDGWVCPFCSFTCPTEEIPS